MRPVLLTLALLLLLATPVAAQNAAAFKRQVAEFDRERAVYIDVQVGSGLSYVFITNGWHLLNCGQKPQLADNARRMWRSHRGSQVVLKDRSGNTFVDFRVFGSGWKIPGC